MGSRLAASFLGLGIAISACTTFSDLTLGSSANVVNPNGKTVGAACTTGDDCQSGSCTRGTCGALTSAQTTDGKKDGSETDVDCGGGNAPQCADGKTCAASTDCTSATCNASHVCAQPAPDDGVKNADETDIDCGGATAPKCAVDKTCATDTDCGTGACSYAMKCLAETARSCTQHFGGDTCGAGETGDANAKHESCCTTIKDPQAGITIGKYQVTAGRMRGFATKFGGNLRAWAKSNPNWDSSYTDLLPTSMAEVNGSFGPLNKRGCQVTPSAKGARTWWQPDISADEKNDFPKDVLDEKTLNCFPWYIALAICTYDGGRLPTNAEHMAITTNNGADTWPWGGSYPNQNAQDPHLTHRYSYATPNAGGIRTSGGEPVDRSFYIAPPGRTPTGANKIGVQDAIGNMLLWNSSAYSFSWTVSWEEHNRSTTPTNWHTTAQSDEEDGYYGIGARCVFDK